MNKLEDYFNKGTNYQKLEGFASNNAILEFQKVIDTYLKGNYKKMRIVNITIFMLIIC